ncbi:PREDICTED: PDZK1-interacting protein 1 isoform X1 [Gekko japonicus]|uniref:PDZK1-interacting protein 1 isoform X1 n=1 Tax=Gekko japonicus TaxID=146911 RepID=A0ABM1L194_GEKJA|nr:PREDICTED: PDZK1-interacting protein 1 isoform X1 [Gekko japonicus]
MNALTAITFSLLVALEPVNCQTVRGNLQPWLQGLIALTVFLVLTGIAFIVHKFWCQDKEKDPEVFKGGSKGDMAISNGTEGNYSTTAANFRCEEGRHVYENTIENDCGNTIEVLSTEM